MGISGVVHNLSKKGIRGTWRIYQENRQKQKLEQQLNELWASGRKFFGTPEGFAALLDDADAKENAILKNLPDKYRVYCREVRGKRLYQLLTDCYRERTFLNLSDDTRAQFMEDTRLAEQALKKADAAAYKKYAAEVKAYYLKELGPQQYAAYANVPVKNKVVFMEKEGPRNAPNGYISDVLKAQGKYEVHMHGLKMRSASRIDHYERAVSFMIDIADAKAVFISSANEILSHIHFRPETKLIQLWHGLGILKKVGYSTQESSKFGASAEEMEEYNPYWNYSYVTLPSMEQAWIFEDAMHIPASSGKLVPVGVSRTDQFYDPAFIQKQFDLLYKKFPQTRDKKIILYAPTYRGRTGSAKAPDAMDIRMMAEALQDEYVLLIKHHSLCKNLPEIPSDLRNTFAFDLNRDSIGAIERSLVLADICITDYSSVAFEYALLERPLIFFAYDLDTYIDNRGLYYQYDEITPGPVCRTTEEMVAYIQSLKGGFDKTEISAWKEKFVGACDGHSTERTIALIEQ